MKLEIALLLLAVAAGVHGNNCRRRCGYSINYVCSTDGNTYDNECMMKCNWAYKSCDGRCPCYRPPVVKRPKPVVIYKPSPPVNNYEPKQPVNNYEQPSVNFYESAPVANYQSPPDYDPLPVYVEPQPVYVDPQPVYVDPQPVYYDAPSQSDCYCSKEKDPVCGYNGETYDNECEANCEGTAKMCDGQCPCT